MTPDKLIASVQSRGARLAVIDGRLKVSPPGCLPPDLKGEILKRAAEIKALLRALGSPPAPATPERPEPPPVATTADAMIAALRGTLAHVEQIAEGAPASVRERIGDLIVEAGPAISLLMMRGDTRALHCALLDLECACRDALTGRGCQ